MKIYGTLTQKEKNIMSPPQSLAKYKKYTLSGDKRGIEQMMIFDAVYIPMIKTIVEEYPAYAISIDWNFSLGYAGKSDVYDMSKFVIDFFKWNNKHMDVKFRKIDDFIELWDLEEKVGWNEDS